MKITKLSKIIFIVTIFTIFYTCSANEDKIDITNKQNTNIPDTSNFNNEYINKYNFKNLLNITYIPNSQFSVGKFGFSDLGAWHGYTLPSIKDKEYYGGFCGPLTMELSGMWVSKSLSQLKIYNMGIKQEIDLSKAKCDISYFPGYLEQNLSINKLKIQIRLFFISNRTSLQETKITNMSSENMILKIRWEGNVLSRVRLSKRGRGFMAKISGGTSYIIVTHKNYQKMEITNVRKSYVLTEQTMSLAPKESGYSQLTHSKYFNNTELENDKNNIISALKNSRLKFKENRLRWENYITKQLSQLSSDFSDTKYKNLSVKCIQTLISNWRSKAGDLLHDGIFPSASSQGFYGFWSWDTWKIAVALSKFAPDLAKSSMLSMFDYQDNYGMVADCIYYNKRENNWRDTKPPLAAWAIYHIYKATNDLTFVKEIFPKLIKYHNWWYANRDFDKNGLCEYGSTDGSLVAAKWESGMDNAVRFDNTRIKKLNNNAWTFNQESVDLNAYLYKEKLFLSKLSKLVGYENKFKEEASDLKKKINDLMFDETTGFYYDIKTDSKEKIKIKGPEGWIPLWANIASKEQAKKVKQAIVNPKYFNTFIPFPTLTADHPRFNPGNGYWRGPVWLDQLFFGVRGLQNYGFNNEAISLTNKLFTNANGMIGTKPLRENYHPKTGYGLNANNFSWSAAHILMLLQK